MTKKELVDNLAQEFGFSSAQMRRIVDSMLRITTEELRKGNRVCFHNFGHFIAVEQTERPGRNPKTGEPRIIPARTTAKFRPGIILLKDLNH